ncbi:MAG: aldo/keto reductase [Turicibacter sp.]|nr:aldo/keto reductase [Turicibacter sp.]
MALTINSTYTLANGVEIPVVGFGTWQTPDGDVAENAVLDAIKAGYRHIDTAAVYKNEEGVGHGIANSGVPREDLFVTTKLWNDAHGYEEAKAALADSLEKLGLDYVDLYLIHWPNPFAIRDSWQEKNQAAWKYMEEALEQGLVRAIGISNFRTHHIDSLLETAKVKPHVNQIYLSPSDIQEDVVAHNEKHGILTQAYSPLGTGTMLEVPALKEMAAKYRKSVAQVAIRWSLQKGFNPLPKSVTTSRIIENIDLFDFELSAADMAVIDGLKGSGKVASNPDEVEF